MFRREKEEEQTKSSGLRPQITCDNFLVKSEDKYKERQELAGKNSRVSEQYIKRPVQ